MKFKSIYLVVVFSIIASCNTSIKEKQSKNTDGEMKVISKESKQIRDYIKKNSVIAHRGTTYWAPEETEPAFLWARNIGADYLELDVQMTKDSVLIALHDDTLERTTNVSELFSTIKNPTVSDFTLKELRSLDAGSWFNKKYPKMARTSFIGLKIMTLEEVMMIAEGFRIKKEKGLPVKEIINNVWTGKYEYEKDPNDNQNRPGVYIETKHPKFDIEKHLKKELTRLGWNINTSSKEIKVFKNKVAVANTKARVILQSFSEESIINLERELPNIPKCLLLWKPDMKGDIKDEYQKAIDFSLKNNVQIIGSSIAGAPNNYEELTAPWMAKLVHNAELILHPYTFDTEKQFIEYKDRVEGIFTNRADLALAFYSRKTEKSAKEVLEELGY